MWPSEQTPPRADVQLIDQQQESDQCMERLETQSALKHFFLAVFCFCLIDAFQKIQVVGIRRKW